MRSVRIRTWTLPHCKQRSRAIPCGFRDLVQELRSVPLTGLIPLDPLAYQQEEKVAKNIYRGQTQEGDNFLATRILEKYLARLFDTSRTNKITTYRAFVGLSFLLQIR
jgi:hypothetical protein